MDSLHRTAPLPADRMRLGRFMLVGVLTGLGGLVLRLGDINGRLADRLGKRSSREHYVEWPLPGQRGSIYDTRFRLMAGTVERTSVFVDPALLGNASRRRRAADLLGRTLQIDPREVLATIQAPADRRFVWLARRIGRERAEEVRRLHLAGVGLVPEAMRIYPLGDRAAHVLGMVGADQRGLDGLEGLCDDHLHGTDGRTAAYCDARRRPLAAAGHRSLAPHRGLSLVLTIDTAIQEMVERRLAEAVCQFEAEGGSAVVIVPSTGEVLALANLPSFEPGRYQDYPVASRRNRLLTDPFEPGSTFKPLIAAAAWAEGVTRPGEVVFCHNGLMPVGRDRIRDHHPYGDLTFEQIIVKSSNIGMAIFGERMGRERIGRWLDRCGLGRPTGIDLPGESSGIVRPVRNWTRYTTRRVPFGHGVSVTGLQLIQVFAMICNDGVMVRPRVVRGLVDDAGRIVEDRSRPVVVGRALPAEIARYFRTVVLAAVVNEGTGKRAQLDGWQVLGKTGTAQIAYADRRGFEPGAYVGSFVGAAPAERPRVVVLVSIRRPEPSKGYYGGTVAAPAVGDILHYVMEYLGVPPRQAVVAGRE